MQLFSGHEEAVVCGVASPEDSCCADHVEEQLLPVASFGKQYVGLKSPVRSPIDADVWRIQAGATAATLTTIPIIAGVDGQNLAAGAWLQFSYNSDFVLVASEPVQMVQFTSGKNCIGAEIGDPAMSVSLPSEHFAKLFVTAPLTGYSEQWVKVVAPTDASVKLNGASTDLANWTSVGSSPYKTKAFAVSELTTIECSAPCMAYAFGYAASTAYAHPLGGKTVGTVRRFRPESLRKPFCGEPDPTRA